MKKKLPNDIPVFPLRDVIFFPNTNLPLNIFENRYLEMVNDILKTENKFLGMIQTKTNNELFNVGCIGQITDQEHLPDGRILINLKGVSRFTINKELETEKKYRVCNVSYEKYAQDIEEVSEAASTNQEMINKTKKFLEKNSILLNCLLVVVSDELSLWPGCPKFLRWLRIGKSRTNEKTSKYL